jgi:hypothetical protein
MGSLLGGSSVLISSTGSVQIRGGRDRAERQVSYWTQANSTSITAIGSGGVTTASPGGAAGAFQDVFGSQIICTTNASSGSAAGVHSTSMNDAETRWNPRASFSCAVNSVANVRLWVGLFSGDPSASDSPAVHIAGFRFSTGASDPAIMAVAKDGTTINAVTTGIALQADAVFTFGIEVSGRGTSIAYYVNGTLTNTLTTNLPTVSTNLGLRSTVTTLAAASRLFSFYSAEMWESAPATSPVSLV